MVLRHVENEPGLSVASDLVGPAGAAAWLVLVHHARTAVFAVRAFVAGQLVLRVPFADLAAANPLLLVAVVSCGELCHAPPKLVEGNLVRAHRGRSHDVDRRRRVLRFGRGWERAEHGLAGLQAFHVVRFDAHFRCEVWCMLIMVRAKGRRESAGGTATDHDGLAIDQISRLGEGSASKRRKKPLRRSQRDNRKLDIEDVSEKERVNGGKMIARLRG
ncbi:hypothetical protein FB451DRAFT_1206364 [Mycena latifolia]|nr:hypothetical protein FB451DRAFT_1206364 [Mycena latifolia]